MNNPFKKAGSFLLDHSHGMLICSLALFACSIGAAALINYTATSGLFVTSDDNATILTPVGISLEDEEGSGWVVDYSDLPDRNSSNYNAGSSSGTYGNSSEAEDDPDTGYSVPNSQVSADSEPSASSSSSESSISSNASSESSSSASDSNSDQDSSSSSSVSDSSQDSSNTETPA